MDNEAMFKLSYGLFVLTAREGEKNNGCIINTAIQAASSPNQLSICVSKANLTHDMIQNTRQFNVSVLNQEASFDLFKHFGFQSGREIDKFANFSSYEVSQNGLVYVTQGTNAYISVNVITTVDLGSHTMFIGTVEDMRVLNDLPSVTYEYYFKHIKPAPAVSQSTDTKKNVWRCKICGYEYVGETIPEDFICPLCKHLASDFEKVII